ncbi:hypothetical protein [EBPR podovirus 2]|nr:hypothetical protein [EBPR podovirus 2]
MAAEKMVTARVLRDYWTEEGERIPAGREIKVPIEALVEGMEKGILERVK